MKKEKDEDLDDLFRKGLEDPVNEAAFRDTDWDAMEDMLDKRKKRVGIVYWLPIAGSAAALLLLFLGWMLFRPKVVKNTKPDQMAVSHHNSIDSGNLSQAPVKKNTGISGGPTEQVADSSKQKTLVPANYAKAPGVSGHGQKNKSFFTLSPVEDRRNTGYPPSFPLKDTVKAVQGAVLAVVKNKQDTAAAKSNLVSAQSVNGGNALLANNFPPKDTAGNKTANAIAATNKVKASIKQSKSGHGPRMALTVLASSDLNGVNSFQQSKIGGNFGLIFSIDVLKKWTVSTGAMYAIKPYLSNISDYHTSYQFPTEPSSVNVNCRMIDIPLNVNYQLYSKRGNRFTIGTGLTSYIILREDYKFNYTGAYAYGPAGYSVINKNRNFFGVLNLDATYDHQISSKLGITLQPYLKLPLSNIGQGQARLQTTGVAVGFNWNLNSSSKP